MVEKNRNLKIFICVVAIFLLVIGGFFIYKEFGNKNTEEKKEEKATITPLLYEVTKEGSNNKIYLFGSIHAANANDLSFPNYILDAYNNSHYLACEADTVNNISQAQQYLLDNLLYKDGTTIKDHLNENTYNKLVEFLTKKNSYVNVYDYYKPYFFISLISNLMVDEANLSANSGIDSHFIYKASNDKKTILEVESIEFQFDLLLSFSDDFYDVYINESIDDFENSVQSLSDLYKYWKDGNAEKLLELANEDIEIKDNYTEGQKKEISEYNQKLITNRNITMTEKVIEYFNNNQDVFFMVGAFHIVGDDGIAKQLEEKGFIVKQIK